MFLFKRPRVICPYCLTEIRGSRSLKRCPKCGLALPVQYVQDYDEHSPFFAQVFGWSSVGKTVFLSGLTLMLVKMSNVWPKYSYAALTDTSQRKLQEIHEYLAKGTMPEPTQLGTQEVYIMILRGMERWGNRVLTVRL